MRHQNTPTQAARDHTATALDMLERKVSDCGLDQGELSARIHLIEAVAKLDASLAVEKQRTGGEL